MIDCVMSNTDLGVAAQTGEVRYNKVRYNKERGSDWQGERARFLINML